MLKVNKSTYRRSNECLGPKYFSQLPENIRKTTSIGRGLKNKLMCKSMFASKNHCAIQLFKNGLIFIIDYKSLNGTFLGHDKIIANRNIQLSDGDMIGIGVEVTDVTNDDNTIYKLTCRLLSENEIRGNTSLSVVPYCGDVSANNNETLGDIKPPVGKICHMGPPPTPSSSTPVVSSTTGSTSPQNKTLQNDGLTRGTVNNNCPDALFNTPSTSKAPDNPAPCSLQTKVVFKTEPIETIELSDESDQEDVRELDVKLPIQNVMETDLKDIKSDDKNSVKELKDVEKLVDENDKEGGQKLDDEDSIEDLTQVEQLVDEDDKKDDQKFDDEQLIEDLTEVEQLVDENVISIESDNEDAVEGDKVNPVEAEVKTTEDEGDPDNNLVLELSVSDDEEEVHLSDNDLESACILAEKEMETSTMDERQKSSRKCNEEEMAENEPIRPVSVSPELIDTIFENEKDAEIIPELLNCKIGEQNCNELPKNLEGSSEEVAKKPNDVLAPAIVKDNDEVLGSKATDGLQPQTMTAQPEPNCSKEYFISNTISKSLTLVSGESSKDVTVQKESSVDAKSATKENKDNQIDLFERITISDINPTTNKINKTDSNKSASNNESTNDTIFEKPRKRTSEIDDTIQEIIKRRLSLNKSKNAENLNNEEKLFDNLGNKHLEKETKENDASIVSFTIEDDDDIILVEDDLPCSQMFSVKEDDEVNINEAVEEDIQEPLEEEVDDDSSVSSADEWLQLLSQGNTVDNDDTDYNDNDLELIDEADDCKDKNELFSEDEYMPLSDTDAAASSETKEDDIEVNKKDSGDDNMDSEEQLVSTKNTYGSKTSIRTILALSDDEKCSKIGKEKPITVLIKIPENSTVASTSKLSSSDEEENLEVEVIKQNRISGNKRKLDVSSDEEVTKTTMIKDKNIADSDLNKLSPEIKVKKKKHIQIYEKTIKESDDMKTSGDKLAEVGKSISDSARSEKPDTKSKKTDNSSKPSQLAKKHKKPADYDIGSPLSNKKLKLVNVNNKDIPVDSSRVTNRPASDASSHDVADSIPRRRPHKNLKKKKRQSSVESNSSSDRSSVDVRPNVHILPDIRENVEGSEKGDSSSTGSSGDWEGLVNNIVASIDQNENKTEKPNIPNDDQHGDDKVLNTVELVSNDLGSCKSAVKESTTRDTEKTEDGACQKLKHHKFNTSNNSELDAVSKKIMASHKKPFIPIIDPKSMPRRRGKSVDEEIKKKQESTSDKWLSNERKQVSTITALTSKDVKAMRKAKLKDLAARESANNVSENKQKLYTSAKNTTKVTSKSRNEIFLDTLVSKESSSIERNVMQDSESKKIKSMASFKIPRRSSKNEDTAQKSVVNTSITEENTSLLGLPSTTTKEKTITKPKAVSSNNVERTASNTTEQSTPVLVVNQILTEQISNSVSNKIKTRVSRVSSKSNDGVENEESPQIIFIPDVEKPLRNLTNVLPKPIIRLSGSGFGKGVKSKKKVVFNRPGDDNDNVLYVQLREFEIEVGNALKLSTRNMAKKDKPPPIMENKEKIASNSHKSYWEELIHQITKWNTIWFKQKNEVKGEPPVFDGQTYHLGVEFMSYNEYRRGMYPLLLFEHWQSLAKQHDLVHKKWTNFNIEILNIKEMEVKNQFVPKQRENEQRKFNRLECQVLLERETSYQWPRLGDLVVLDLQAVPNIPTDCPKCLRLLAYIATGTGARPIVTRCNVSHKLRQQYPKATQVMNFTLYTKNFMYKIDRNKEIRLVVLKNIKSDLREFDALDRLPSSPLMPMILQPKANDAAIPPVELKQIYQPNAHLNSSQKKAVVNVAKACSSNLNMIHLIHGPPGCGKSEVIIGIIQQMWFSWFNKQATCPRILLCAPSNAAIDDLFFRLMSIRQGLTKKKFNMVRIGRTDMAHRNVSSMTLDHLVDKELKKAQELMEDDDHRNIELGRLEAKKNSLSYQLDNPGVKNSVEHRNTLEKKLADTIKKIKQLQGKSRNGGLIDPKELREKKKEAEMNLLENAHIIATTLSSCYNTQMEQAFLAKRLQLTCCIVDEATQCSEPETLIPLMLGIRSLVLVGDPQQLPATVLSSTAKDHGLGRSMFARQQEWWQQNLVRDPSLSVLYETRCHFLDTQYRMHPAIAQWPSEYFYKRALRTHDNLENRIPNFPFQPYVVLSHNFQQSRQEECNYEEAKMIVNLVTSMLQHLQGKQIRATIGVITPYNQQRGMLRKQLDKENAAGVEVGTVDSYQGRERDIIIMSCVRTEGVGFLSGPERLNVALTRAKHSLVICGNFRSLQVEADSTWASLLDNAKSRGVFKSLTNCNPTSSNILQEIAKPDFY